MGLCNQPSCCGVRVFPVFVMTLGTDFCLTLMSPPPSPQYCRVLPALPRNGIDAPCAHPQATPHRLRPEPSIVRTQEDAITLRTYAQANDATRTQANRPLSTSSTDMSRTQDNAVCTEAEDAASPGRLAAPGAIPRCGRRCDDYLKTRRRLSCEQRRWARHAKASRWFPGRCYIFASTCLAASSSRWRV